MITHTYTSLAEISLMPPLEASKPPFFTVSADKKGNVTYLPVEGPRLRPEADYHTFLSVLDAENYLLERGGWLENLWGPMEESPAHWVRTVAANVASQNPNDSSWLL